MKCLVFAVLLCVTVFVTAEVKFKPADLPCAFVITVETNTSEDNQGKIEELRVVNRTYIHGTYGKVISEQTYPNVSSEVIIVRTDIRDEKTGLVAVAVIDSDGGNQCVQHSADRFIVNDTYTELLAEFVIESEFNNVSKGQFEGKNCSVYYRAMGTIDEYYYVDAMGYIIGIYKHAPNGNLSSRVSYEFSADLSQFTVDATKNPGCYSSMSVVPALDTCKNLTFKPATIPCTMLVTAEVVSSLANGTKTGDVTTDFYFRGTMMKLHSMQSYPMKADSFSLLRTDIFDKKTDSVAYFHIPFGNSSQCVEHMKPREEITKQLHNYVSPLFNSFNYEAKIEGKYKGESAMFYYQFIDIEEPMPDEAVVMYVMNKQNYIVEYTEKTKTSIRKVSLSYKENGAPMSAFVMPKSEGCSAKAYTAPTEDPCKKPSPSSSHGAGVAPRSSYGVVFATILLLCVSVYHSLF